MGLSIGDILDEVFDIITGKWVLDTLLNSDFVLQQNNDFWNSMGDKTFVGGYEYYMGMHLGVCSGPVDKITRIRFNKRIGWEGEVTPGAPDASGQIVINKPSLWGGRKPGNGGGVAGIVDVLFGAPDQTQNVYLAKHMGADNTPAFRGRLTLVFRHDFISVKDYYNKFLKSKWTGVYEARREKLSEPATHHTGFYWAARQKMVPEVDVELVRLRYGWSNGCWEPDLVEIGGNEGMNGAHIIYQSMSDRVWGMKRAEEFIDYDYTFLAAAQRLYNEGFALHFYWSSSTSVENLIGQVLTHIDAELPFNPSLGKFELKLIRGTEDLMTLDGEHLSSASTVTVQQNIPVDIPTEGVVRIGSLSYDYNAIDFGTRTFTLTAGTLGVTYPDETDVYVTSIADDDIPHFTADDIVGEGDEGLGTFTRMTWGETINKVTLIYTNPDNDEPEAVTLTNPANIAIQGEVNPTEISMPGIRNRDLASRVCARELRGFSTPLASITGLKLTTKASGYTEGSLIRLTIPEYGLEDARYRVTKFEDGTLRNSTITLDVVEDVFSMPDVPFAAVVESIWVSPLQEPQDVVNMRYVDVPYHTLVMRSANLGNIDTVPGAAYFAIMAELPAEQNRTINVYADVDDDPSDSVLTCSGGYCPTALLVTTVGKYDTVLRFNTPVFLNADLLPGTWCYLDDEKIGIVSVDDTYAESLGYWDITVKRGVLDTLPAAHNAGAKFWFFNSSAGALYLSTQFSAGDSPYLFAVGQSAIGESEIGDAPYVNPTMSAKWFKPYPPANVLINGELEPSDALYGFTITWAGRNRLTQDSVLVGWDEGHIAPEPGTLYTLEVRNGATDVVIATHTDLECGENGGSYTFYDSNSAPYYKISLWATRDGVASEVYTYTASDMSGFDYNFDYMFGGRSEGVLLEPGTTLPAVSTLYDQTPMATWINGKWRHFNFDAAADASYGVRTIATDESITRSSADDGETWTTDNIDDGADRPLSAKVVLFADSRYVAIGGKYLWHKTDAASSWTKQDSSTWPNNFSGSGDIDSVTHDGTNYIISVNRGKDIYTSTALATFTRQGTTGATNNLTLIMDCLWIKYNGSEYIAAGYNAVQDITIASSADLVTWTEEPGFPSMKTNPFDWVYFSGEWYAFGTIGDALVGRLGCYKSADLVTWTVVNIPAPMNTPMFGHPFITTTGMSVFGGAYVFESTDGATWTSARCKFNPLLAAFARTRTVLGDTETPPTNILLRTGIRAEDFDKDDTYVGNARKGKILAVNSWTDADATLVYPAGATYDEKIGTLGDFSKGISDAGFKISYAAVDTAALKGRNSGKYYFEILVSDLTVPSTDPTNLEVGVCIAAGASETFITSSAMLDGIGRFYANGRLSCPGGVVGGNIEPVQTDLVLGVGSVIGVLCDFTAKTITLKHNNVDISNATVSDIPTNGCVWFPVFTGAKSVLRVNLGQSAFIYTQSGYTGWNY